MRLGPSNSLMKLEAEPGLVGAAAPGGRERGLGWFLSSSSCWELRLEGLCELKGL